MTQSNAQRAVNVIRSAVEQMTRDGATTAYRYGIVNTGGSYLISAYIEGETSVATEDIRVYAGTYLNPGNYIIVGSDDEGEAWIEDVIPTSLYSKLVFDYNVGQVKIGDGTTEPATGTDGQLLFSAGPNLANYWDDNFAGELRIPVKNNTGATLTAGTAVYISSVSGQIAEVSKASSTSEPTSSKTLGLVTKDIADTAQGYVTTFGIIKNVNTSAYSPGTSLWLSSTAGEWTNVKAVPPNHLVSIGKVIHDSATAGRIFVSIQNGFELEELHNVYIQSTPSDGQVLKYDAASAYWKPGTASTIAALDDLTDVTITTPSNGQALKYNGTQWVNGTAAAYIDDLTDVTITSAVNGNVLSYNGTAWVNSTPAANTYSGTSLTLTQVGGSGPVISSTSTVTSLFPSSSYITENWDTDNWHSATTNVNRITPNKSGKILITASVGFAANGTGNRFIQIWVNGTSTGTAIAREQVTGTATQQTWLSATGVYDFNSGTPDYVEVYVAQTSGGNLEVVGAVVTAQLVGGLKGDTGATGATGPAGPEGGTTLVTSTSATNTSVADAATAQTILASNASRKGFSIYNDSAQVAYVKFGSAATTTDFTMKLAAYGFYEMFGDCLYTGAITAIWAADSTGSARVTEW